MHLIDYILLAAIAATVAMAIKRIRTGKAGCCSGRCCSCDKACGKHSD